jgi:hypothetical protein
MKFLLLFCIPILLVSQTMNNSIESLITNGEFTKAEELINKKLNEKELDEIERYDLMFRLEVMNRIRKDFKKTGSDILKYIRKYFPEAQLADLVKWEDAGTLEYKIIDGEKRYFNRSHTNLFRVDSKAKSKKIEIEGNIKDGLDSFLEEYIPKVVSEAKSSGKSIVKPVKIKLFYELSVDADAVPAGEIIRCWLPYPREGHKRQQGVKLLHTSEKEYVIADNNNLQRTIYMEKKAKSGKATEFKFEAEYLGFNEWHKLDEKKLEKYKKKSELYKRYTSERLPHIEFTDKVKKLSKKIVGTETNPMKIAGKIYKWINDNIPWAGAREYSTIQNISDYCLTNGWGDCGIQTLTFMTLCRYNGIPAKWQSGWMLHPGEVNLHDWCEIYFESYGWVPVDQSFKLIDSDDEDVQWFFFGGIDAYHLIVNDDYSQPLFPAKIFPRSETVDFQRGEVEWRGGNLYFDKWDYNMSVEYDQIKQ